MSSGSMCTAATSITLRADLRQHGSRTPRTPAQTQTWAETGRASTMRRAVACAGLTHGHARIPPAARRRRAFLSSRELRTWCSPSGCEGERPLPAGNMGSPSRDASARMGEAARWRRQTARQKTKARCSCEQGPSSMPAQRRCTRHRHRQQTVPIHPWINRRSTVFSRLAEPGTGPSK